MAQAIKLCFLQLQQLFCRLKNKPHIQADVKKKIKYHYLAMSEKNSWILLKLKVYFSPSGK